MSAGETELAILKGVTMTGHDPAYVRDAFALDKALRRMVEMAQDKAGPTDLDDVRELHALILGERSGAGLFRNQPVLISGSRHRPPRAWAEIMAGMEAWEAWSRRRAGLPGPVRSVVLHAWLAHIHPFIDGNGRTARAIGNLELVRAGYPSAIIKKKDRSRYLDALGEADEAGDLQALFEFLLERMEGSLQGLELSARQENGYDPAVIRLRSEQERGMKIWLTQVKLLVLSLEDQLQHLSQRLAGKVVTKCFEDALDLDEYRILSQGQSMSRSWSFILEIEIPALEKMRHLAWFGYRSSAMREFLGTGGPALYWSVPNPEGYPRWMTDTARSPRYVEMTMAPENPSAWVVRDRQDVIRVVSSMILVRSLAADLWRVNDQE
ncbi:MAG: Fic family protein [Magnetococcales bacterium]|nr:Fic family protein [Magnetococcales bacterium]